MGLRRLITEFLWPFQLHHQTLVGVPYSHLQLNRLWLPYSTKSTRQDNQTSPNSVGLRRLITEFLWPPSSSIIRSALCVVLAQHKSHRAAATADSGRLEVAWAAPRRRQHAIAA
ncbi:hypothetical protein EVAR_64460_1 [Eumeta japonica]|uniref:Uncharacterized protein n=1 Tax=Eumeta variegata TaxID=151549 RepID=A0A4C1ZJX4_EUMVA|nr:hypothetical protein EVAR_64460_1 [Eumeta japonica]